MKRVAHAQGLILAGCLEEQRCTVLGGVVGVFRCALSVAGGVGVGGGGECKNMCLVNNERIMVLLLLLLFMFTVVQI